MSEIEYRVLRSEVSNGIDWQTEGRTLLSLCKGWLIAEGSENHIGNAADLLEQLEGQTKLGIDHLEVLKELLDGIKKCALVDKIEIFEIKRKNYLCMSEKVIRKLDELNCLERLIRICTPYLEEGIVDRIENIRFLFKKLESNCRLGPANLGILKEILKEVREDELLREVEEFEKQRKDEKIRDRRRKEAEERRQGENPSLISLGLACVNYE